MKTLGALALSFLALPLAGCARPLPSVGTETGRCTPSVKEQRNPNSRF